LPGDYEFLIQRVLQTLAIGGVGWINATKKIAALALNKHLGNNM
jgi:hypothetical protein